MKHSRCCFMEQLLSEKILASAEKDPKRRALRRLCLSFFL